MVYSNREVKNQLDDLIRWMGSTKSFKIESESFQRENEFLLSIKGRDISTLSQKQKSWISKIWNDRSDS